MAEIDFSVQSKKWTSRIKSQFGKEVGEQFFDVLVDLFESQDELSADLEQEDWCESALMDTLHNDASIYFSEKFCETFYSMLRLIVADKAPMLESVESNEIILSAVSPYKHHSRRKLDTLLIYGYCRAMVECLENIIEVLLLYYHVPIILSNIDFNITDTEISETKKMYELQCASLSPDAIHHQYDLWKALTISRKNRLPLLLLCFDTFCRDRLNYFIEKRQSLTLSEWKIRYKVLKKIAPNKPKYHDILKSAIETFMLRYTSALQLPVLRLYNDDLERYTDLIIGASQFIQTLLNSDGISPPFQVELVIIAKDMIDTDINDGANDGGQPEFDDSDSDCDSDSDSSENDHEDSGMPDIGAQLKQNNIKYQNVTAKSIRPRQFHTLYTQYKYEALNTKDFSQFSTPHRQRLCIAIDRRQSQNELYMFQPNTFCDFPSNHFSEWYFESTYQCIVPSRLDKHKIRSKDSRNGSVFCLSFHCQEKDQIKCYLYTRAQCIRFLPKDIYHLLPFLFVRSEKNNKFVEREKNIKTRQKTQKIKIFDKLFEDFRRQIHL